MFSSVVNVRYDAKPAINQITVAGVVGGNSGGSGSNSLVGTPVATSGLGVKTSVTNITSTSYRGGGSNGIGGNVAGGDILSIPDLANTEFNVGTNNGKNVAITRDTSINVTTTGEARADMVYSLNSGYADSNNLSIQYPTWNPLTFITRDTVARIIIIVFNVK